MEVLYDPTQVVGTQGKKKNKLVLASNSVIITGLIIQPSSPVWKSDLDQL